MQHASSPADTGLPTSHKWRMAVSLIFIYSPILFYISFPEWAYNWAGIGHMVPRILLSLAVSLVLYFVWLYPVEWVQYRLFRWYGEDFLLELKLPAQVVTVLASGVLAAGYILAFTSVMRLLFSIIPELNPVFPTKISSEHIALFRRANDGFFMMLMLSAFYLVANNQALLRVRASHARAEQLETENLHARFAALKSQVNPHFLFNSLSILSSLVHVDADLSEKFIDQLSRAYRYTLEQQDHDLVPLQTELAFIESYTFLLKIRFDEKFDVQLNVPEAARHTYQIAPLTLQLLVENAVKHNTMSQQKPLLVRIEVAGDELVVRNTLQRRPATYTSTGVGLNNIRNRYQLLTGRRVQVAETGGDFIVRIPLLSA